MDEGIEGISYYPLIPSSAVKGFGYVSMWKEKGNHSGLMDEGIEGISYYPLIPSSVVKGFEHASMRKEKRNPQRING